MSPARPRATALALVATATAAALHAAPAGADYPSASLVSIFSEQQAYGATTAVDVSADGRYVVWSSQAPNLVPAGPRGEVVTSALGRVRRPIGGIFRTDLQTGASELVAQRWGGSEQVGAQRPAISADGRWVVFNANLVDPREEADGGNVWVRDMSRPIDDAAAFELVSAADASTTATGGYVDSAGAISDDGDTIAYLVGDVVMLRTRSTQATRAVSVARDPGTGAMTDMPVGGNRGPHVSGDGSTVAWIGVGDGQVPLFASEYTSLGGGPLAPNFMQVLWRRMAEGAGARTRRVASTGDPDDPACDGDLSRQLTADVALAPQQPCDGPLLDTAQSMYTTSGATLALSRDGRRVALASFSRPRGVPETGENRGDVFLATVYPGESRKQALREITRQGLDLSEATATNVSDVTISPDGSRIAFSTSRVRFPGTRFGFAGAGLQQPGVVATYVADLTTGTIELASRPRGGVLTSDGGETGITQPSLSERGLRLAFVSSAANLAAGDGNRAADAFVTQRVDVPDADRPGADVELLPPMTPQLEARPDWLLRATARTSRDGSLALTVGVPGAGTVRATAADEVAGRDAARASAAPAGAGETRLLLRPTAAARADLREHGALDVVVTVAFAPAAGASGGPLERTLRARLRLVSDPAELLAPQVSRVAGGALRLRLTAPAAGVVSAVARPERPARSAAKGAAAPPLATARRVVLDRRSLTLTLRPAPRALRRTLPVRITVRHRPAEGGRTTTTSVRASFRPVRGTR